MRIQPGTLKAGRSGVAPLMAEEMPVVCCLAAVGLGEASAPGGDIPPGSGHQPNYPPRFPVFLLSLRHRQRLFRAASFHPATSNSFTEFSSIATITFISSAHFLPLKTAVLPDADGLGAMKFHKQRGGPSRPLFSRARACPCPRRLCCEKIMPAAHAVVLGPKASPEIGCSSPPSAQGHGRL